MTPEHHSTPRLGQRPLALSVTALFTLGMVCVFGASGASAAFQTVEDFEQLSLGAIDGQGDWTAENDTSIVTADPFSTGNQILSVTTDSTYLYSPLVLPDGESHMVFLRFSFGGQQTYSFGLSAVANPDQFGLFEVELGMSNNSNVLNVNDGVVDESVITLQPDTWYNTWLFIDNASDTYQVWLHDRDGESALPTDLLATGGGQSEFLFRNGGDADLVSFFIKTGGGSSINSGPLYLDDIFLEAGNGTLDLSNPVPVPEPSSALYLVIGTLLVSWSARRSGRRSFRLNPSRG
jgi:hypothetical protein